MSKEIEEWKPIKGYEGLYEVSDWGNVKSLNYRKTGKVIELKKVEDKDGYHLVTLKGIEGDFVKEYHSINEAARNLKCDNRGVSRCINGEYKTHKGFIWRLKK